MTLATQPRRARTNTRASLRRMQAPGTSFSRFSRFARLEEENSLIQRIIEDVAANFSEPLTLREIGEAHGYSVYQIIRTFRRLLGTTPHAYIMNLRICYAAERLGQGDTIAGAAADAGFSDQSHMTRHFKRIFGATPLQYVRGAGFAELNLVRGFAVQRGTPGQRPV
jgi:AraC-like DNA-binding protein